MNRQIALLLAILAVSGASTQSSFAHPASGIVVDPQGAVYFVYSGHGVCKVEPHGQFSYVHRSRGGHWMCLDPQGSFARGQPKFFERITTEGAKPALIFADGGSPIAVLPDGNLYYVSNDDSFSPGGLRVTRNSPDGALSHVSVGANAITERLGVTGLADGPNGTLYVASPSSVLKVRSDGAVSTLISPIHLEGCDVDYPDGDTNNALPYLRGLSVDERGTVFAAGTACHCVVKITPDGKAAVVLKAERPWSPTGVALYHSDIYILEYTHATEGSVKGWRPRIRKLAPDGALTVLVTVPTEGTAR